jgi:hypothetical protein
MKSNNAYLLPSNDMCFVPSKMRDRQADISKCRSAGTATHRDNFAWIPFN